MSRVTVSIDGGKTYQTVDEVYVMKTLPTGGIEDDTFYLKVTHEGLMVDLISCGEVLPVMGNTFEEFLVSYIPMEKKDNE